MIDIAPTSEAQALLISFVLVVPFAVWLRPRLLSLAGGATFVTLVALLVEVLVQNALQPLNAAAIVPVVGHLRRYRVGGKAYALPSATPNVVGGFPALRCLDLIGGWGCIPILPRDTDRPQGSPNPTVLWPL